MPDEDDRYLLALEEARRAIDTQKEDLKAIRDRTTAIVTVASIAASFIGGLAFRDKSAELGDWSWVAIGLFVLIALITVLIYWPRTFTFTQKPSVIIEDWIEKESPSLARMRRDLAYYLHDQYTANRAVLNWMIVGHQAAVAFLAFEILALLLDLRGR